jgi:hypothetical protein
VLLRSCGVVAGIQVTEVDFHEDMKEVSIAMVSTSALLLTILVVVHIPYSVWVPFKILTASGLYLTIGFGVVEFIFLVIASREQVSREKEVTNKMLLTFFILQIITFLCGLSGIFVTVLAASLS